MRLPIPALGVFLVGLSWTSQVLSETPAKPVGMAELLAASKADDWRRPDPANTLYLELASGRVVIELAPQFAPNHVANIKTLVQEKYFDELSILRVQENYVVQWGDPNAEAGNDSKKSMGSAKSSLEGEYQRERDKSLPITMLPDGDTYAGFAGISSGFPVAGQRKKVWLAHCYGMVGAGRGDTSDSGSGAELYVVIGHAPRHLDRNVTLVGRVLSGMEHLTTLERGTGALGFIEHPGDMVQIHRIRLANEIPEAERTNLEVLRTDTPLFRDLIEARRTRREAWFLEPTGRIELCNVPIPVRTVPKAP